MRIRFFSVLSVVIPGTLVFLFGAGAALADTEVVQVTFSPTVPAASRNPPPNGTFAEFDPALGTLTSYSLTVAGTVTSTDDCNTAGGGGAGEGCPLIAYFTPGTDHPLLDFGGSSDSFNFNRTGTTSASADLADVLGPGIASFGVGDLDEDNTVTTIDYTQSFVTYTYTPAATPEPSSLMLLATGALGFAGFIRRRLL